MSKKNEYCTNLFNIISAAVNFCFKGIVKLTLKKMLSIMRSIQIRKVVTTGILNFTKFGNNLSLFNDSIVLNQLGFLIHHKR